jgi:hypothetical protein
LRVAVPGTCVRRGSARWGWQDGPRRRTVPLYEQSLMLDGQVAELEQTTERAICWKA